MRGDQRLLFGHLIGVLTLFGAIAIENVTLFFMLRARTVEDLRGATTFAPLLARLFPAGVVLILAFGIGLVAHSDEFKFGQAWIDLSFGLLIVLAILGPLVQGRRMDATAHAARTAQGGPLPADLAAMATDPIMRTAAVTSSWLAIGIVFLMTRQPGWGGSWLTILVFGLVGLGMSMVLSQARPVEHEGPARQ